MVRCATRQASCRGPRIEMGRKDDGQGHCHRCVIFAVLGGCAATGPGGVGLPIASQIVMTMSLRVVSLVHMWTHLGGSLMAAFFAPASPTTAGSLTPASRSGGVAEEHVRRGIFATSSNPSVHAANAATATSGTSAPQPSIRSYCNERRKLATEDRACQ
jgi:hypothetical protein